MTQQNAALMEQGAAAAQYLEDQAEQLAQAAGVFVVADENPIASEAGAA
jgi:methyl-accepting chemotaxis protein